MTVPLMIPPTLSATIAALPETLDSITPDQWRAIRFELSCLASQARPREEGTLVRAVDLARDMPDSLEGEEGFRIILASIGDAVITTDPLGRVTYLNPVAEALTGWDTAKAVGQPMEQVFSIIDDRTGQRVENPLSEVLATGLTRSLDDHTSLVAKTGHIMPIEDSAAPIKSAGGETLGVVMVFHDVTEKRKKDDELRRLNRTLTALTYSSQSMLRAVDEAAYLEEVCRIVTEDCGHAMVWIGFAEDDSEKTVRPVAHAGFEVGYLETLRLTWADSERGQGPTGTAIRTGKVSMCRNMLTDPKFEPWRAEALKRGYASSIVLPLKTNGLAFGALTIYSRRPDPFSDDEVKLLSELTSDLAYGISAIRQRLARAAAEAALQESEARYRSLFQGMTEGFALHQIICDERGVPCDYRFLEVNPAFECLTGLQAVEVKGKLKSEVPQLQGDDPMWVEVYGKVALTGEPVHFENYSPPLNATYEVFAFSPASMQFAVIFLNVTERKRMEASIVQNTAQVEAQRRLIDQREQERLQIARDLHDGPMQELAAALFTLQCAIQDSTDEAYCCTLEELRGSLQHQLQELRDYACDLRPPTLSRFGLKTAIMSHVDTYRLKHCGIEIRYKLQPVDRRLPEEVQLALFRIYQQAMNNVAKHAHATRVEIRLKKTGDRAILEVLDNGNGFNVPQDWLELARQKHLGLVGMRERSEAIGGRLELTSTPGHGTVLRVGVPLGIERGQQDSQGTGWLGTPDATLSLPVNRRDHTSTSGRIKSSGNVGDNQAE
ncbi:MAG TPA: PAS domain S-box protein [Anaerolineaceae bacterium]